MFLKPGSCEKPTVIGKSGPMSGSHSKSVRLLQSHSARCTQAVKAKAFVSYLERESVEITDNNFASLSLLCHAAD
jgi:hypothetical protein